MPVTSDRPAPGLVARTIRTTNRIIPFHRARMMDLLVARAGAGWTERTILLLVVSRVATSRPPDGRLLHEAPAPCAPPGAGGILPSTKCSRAEDTHGRSVLDLGGRDGNSLFAERVRGPRDAAASRLPAAAEP